MMEHIFRFNNYGTDLGTRRLGAQVRSDLIESIEKYQLTVLDFDGVNVVANCFADECIGKLLEHMSLQELKSKTTFRNVNPMARICITNVIRRRLL